MSQKVEKQIFRKSTKTFFYEQMRKLVYERLQVSVDVLDEVLVKDPKCQGKEFIMTQGIQTAAKKISDTMAMEIDRFELFVGRNVFTAPNNSKKNNNELLSIMRGPGDSTHPPPSKSEVTSSTKQTHFPPQSYREPPAEPSPDNDLSYDLTQEKKSTKKRKKPEQHQKSNQKNDPKPSKKRRKTTSSPSSTPVTSEELDILRKNILQKRALKSWLEREMELQVTDTRLFKDMVAYFPEFWKIVSEEKSGVVVGENTSEQPKAINVIQLRKMLEGSNEIFKNVRTAETVLASQGIQIRRGDSLATRKLTRNNMDFDKVFEIVNRGGKGSVT